MIVTVALREGVEPPPDATWLKPRTFYTARVLTVADGEAMIRIFGPGDARCVMSSRFLRRIADDWPDH